MRTGHHSERVSEAVREELTEIVSFELSDPRLASVDVTEVTISPDAKHAHVKVNLRGDEREQHQALAALEHARHYLRHELAGRLKLRKVPELHFEFDKALDAEARVEVLLKRAKGRVSRDATKAPKL